MAEDDDLYAILVSEVMAQQTQVDRVVPRYLDWLSRWPTAASLAAQSTADVIRAWQGLGYNRRALNLQRAARHVAERGWPDDLTELPGVGPYTAAAVGNFAFGRDVLPVDTNVRRVHGAHRRGLRLAGCGPGAHGSRSDDLPGAHPSLPGLPARGGMPVPRAPLRATPQAEPLRGLVPAAAREHAPARRGGGARRLDDLDAELPSSPWREDGLVVVEGTWVRLPA